MEDRVVVIDENSVKVGKTYQRRARQLVNKQRAVWADEKHSAILLSPAVDSHEWQEAEAIIESLPVEEMPGSDSISWDDDRLYALAAKRVRERKWFIWHTAAFLPGYIILFIIWGGFLDQIYYAGTSGIFWFLNGCWSAGYIIHACSFIKPRLKNYRRRSEANRIKAEMEKIRVMDAKKIRMELERSES